MAEPVELTHTQDLLQLARAGAGLVEARYAQKYSADLRAASLFQPDENPDAYLVRLHNLYPEPSQQAYIDAVWHTVGVGDIGVTVFSLLSEKKDVPPQALELFPLELNQDLVGIDLEKENAFKNAKIVMRPEAANAAISACNLGAHHVEKFGKDLLRSARAATKALLSGKGDLGGLPMLVKAKIMVAKASLEALRATLGDNFDRELDAIVDKAVKFEDLDLLTDRAAQHMKDSSKALGGPFNPIDAYVRIPGSSLALDNLNIYPEIIDGMHKAMRKKFGFPPIEQAK